MVDEVRARLMPVLTEILESLARERNDTVAAFFDDIRRQLERVETEAELMGPFLQLAGTAPVVNAVGVAPATWFKIDELLALSQEIAHTLSASSQQH
jgi:hypothetical protein